MTPLYKKYAQIEYDKNNAVTKFSVTVPENFNFGYDVVDVIAKEEPQKTALVWCNPEGQEKIISFKEMSDLSSMTANYLKAQGIKKGDRVMLMLKRHFEYWYVLIALEKLGVIAIPATHMLKKDDVTYRINTVDISAIICADDKELTDTVLSAVKETGNKTQLYCVRKDIDSFIRLDKEITLCQKTFERIETHSKEPFMLYFTSGTTGEPKPVMHDYAYPLGHIVTAKFWQGVKDNGLHLSVADTGWAKASWGKIFGQWLCGAAVMAFDYDCFYAKEMIHAIKKYHVTSFCAPPTVYRLLMKSKLHKDGFAEVEEVTTAGEAANPELFEQFKADTGLTIREGYGQTESTILVGTMTWMKSKPGSMGKPSPLYNIIIADENGKKVDDGEDGEIVILSDSERNIGIRIIKEDDDKQSLAFPDGIYHTGDIAHKDSEGYFWYVGRKDSIIKSSGYRISPYEVENAIMKHPAVYECKVFGVPDKKRGLSIKALIVLNNEYTASDKLSADVKEFVKTNIALYKYPRIIEFVDELPKTISGKIKRSAETNK